LDIYAVLVNSLVTAIRSKFAFHRSHTDVRGNFAIPGTFDREGSIPDLRRHLTSVMVETSRLQSSVVQCDEFALVVLWRSLVEEGVNAYRLLRLIDKSADGAPLISRAAQFIGALSAIPYIASTVLLPTDNGAALPRELFRSSTALPELVSPS
jgi:hypothetical protein